LSNRPWTVAVGMRAIGGISHTCYVACCTGMYLMYGHVRRMVYLWNANPLVCWQGVRDALHKRRDTSATVEPL
jgi:hypothetical protein